MKPSLAQKAIAELLGTFILVFFGGMAALLSAGSGVGLLGVALAFGLALAAAIHIFGKISGGHYNPAVTTAMLATGRIDPVSAGAYYVAQIGGAALAALVQYVLLKQVLITAIAPTATGGGAVIAEIVGTFLLASVIFGVAVDGRAPAGWAPWSIGMVLPTAAMALGPISGGSFNPAVSIGPRLVASITGLEAQWGQIWIYLVGPIVGAVLGAFVYDFVAQPRKVENPVQKAVTAEPTVGKGRK